MKRAGLVSSVVIPSLSAMPEPMTATGCSAREA